MSSLVGLQDRRYQNSSNIVSASWHGFVDLGSSLQSYHWCVSPMPAIGSCSVLPVQNVGLATKKEIQLSLHVPNGLYFFQSLQQILFLNTMALPRANLLWGLCQVNLKSSYFAT